MTTEAVQFTVRLSPHSVEAEEAVLGSILIDPECFAALSFLNAADFFLTKHTWIWEALLSLIRRGDGIDYITVIEELKHQQSDGAPNRLDDVGGAAYITYLINHTPPGIMAEVYARIVERAATRRRLITAAQDIVKLAYDEEKDINAVLDEAKAVLDAVTNQPAQDDPKPIEAIASAAYDELEKAAEDAQKKKPRGLRLGFTTLDAPTGGLFPGQFVVVAGRPGMGKTSFMLSSALNVVQEGKRVLFFSAEMTSRQIYQRLVAMQSGITTQKQRAGELDKKEMAEYLKTMAAASKFRLWIDDCGGLTAPAISRKTRRIKARYGLDLVVVDYIQLLDAVPATGQKHQNREAEVAAISKALKNMAKALEVPVMAAAQLNRQVTYRSEKIPMLSDLRDSGSLEQDADIVIFLYQEGDQQSNMIDVSIAKNRDGDAGEIAKLYFQKHITRFGNLTRQEPPPLHIEEKTSKKADATHEAGSESNGNGIYRGGE